MYSEGIYWSGDVKGSGGEDMDLDRTANLLGALALALSDDMEAAVRERTGMSPTACAALATLGPYPGATIGAVARVLGVTHSVAVRTIDDLVQKGHIARAEGDDRRQVKLRLTGKGTKLRSAILAARNAVLCNALAAVDAKDRRHFDTVVSALLTRVTSSRAKADHICRLCDEFVCTPDTCPVEKEAVTRSSRGSGT